jgi:hypothetical protein
MQRRHVFSATVRRVGIPVYQQSDHEKGRHAAVRYRSAKPGKRIEVRRSSGFGLRIRLPALEPLRNDAALHSQELAEDQRDRARLARDTFPQFAGSEFLYQEQFTPSTLLS